MSDAQATSPESRPGDEERTKTIAKRQEREKQAVVEQLKKIPIVQVACEKVGISRGTYYNWKHDDEEFAKQADEAIGDGTGFVNDMAESQLLSAIKEGNLGAITYWLKHRHVAYSNRLELTAKVKQDTDELTEDQEELVRKALSLAAFSETESDSPAPSSPNSISPTSHEPESTSRGTENDRPDVQGPQSAD